MYEQSNDNIPKSEWILAEREARAAERTKRANERFAAASPARKRVIVARDGLKWLETRKWVPAHHYLTVRGPADQYKPGTDKVNGYSCEACALGGILACVAERGATSILRGPDGLVREGSDIWAALKGIFERAQLLLIEAAYEGDVSRYYAASYKHGNTPEHVRKALADADIDPSAAYEWRGHYPSDTKRLQAILQNIIANKGTFVP